MGGFICSGSDNPSYRSLFRILLRMETAALNMRIWSIIPTPAVANPVGHGDANFWGTMDHLGLQGLLAESCFIHPCLPTSPARTR